MSDEADAGNVNLRLARLKYAIQERGVPDKVAGSGKLRE